MSGREGNVLARTQRQRLRREGEGRVVASYAVSLAVAITLELDRATAAMLLLPIKVLSLSVQMSQTHQGLATRRQGAGREVAGREGGSAVAGFKGLWMRATDKAA